MVVRLQSVGGWRKLKKYFINRAVIYRSFFLGLLVKIKTLETFSNKYVSFVKITTDTNDVGWGQMSTYNADITSQIFHRQVSPWSIGLELDEEKPNFSDHLQIILEREHKFPGSYLLRALSGLDTALWDLYGNLKEKPVASLIGGGPGKIRVYGSSMRRDITSINESIRLCKLRDELGINAFKFRVGSECGRDKDEWDGRSKEIVKTLSRDLGNKVDKLVDGNSCFSPEKAIELGKFMQDMGVTHFEEPCPYWEHDQTKVVKEALEIDVAGGEQDCDMSTWKSTLQKRIVDIAQPDVMYMGGMYRTLEVANMANKIGLPCTPHAANLSLVTICTKHLLTAIPNAGKYLEFSIEDETYYPWQKDIFNGDPFKIVDGFIEVTNEPGWGVQINSNWLEHAKYEISEGTE